MRHTYGKFTYFLTEKGSAIDKRLFAMLQDGASIDMILKIKSDTETENDLYFLITDIISTSFSKY